MPLNLTTNQKLVVVIGRRAQYLTEEEVFDYIAGYTVGHDVSERAFQRERGGQFTKGKSADTFAPVGPYLVTRDHIDDVQNLSIWSEVNGEMRQQGKHHRYGFRRQGDRESLESIYDTLPW